MHVEDAEEDSNDHCGSIGRLVVIKSLSIAEILPSAGLIQSDSESLRGRLPSGSRKKPATAIQPSPAGNQQPPPPREPGDQRQTAADDGGDTPFSCPTGSEKHLVSLS